MIFTPLLRRITRIALLMLAGLVLLSPPLAQAAEVPFVGLGASTYSKKKDAMVARQKAIDEATADAVKKALPRYMPAEVLKAKEEEIATQVLPLSAAFVKRVEVVKEEDIDKCYKVTVKAFIDEATLRQNLDGLGFSQDVGSRRSIAVIIDEYFQGDQKPQDPNKPILKSKVDIEKKDASYDRSVDASHDARVAASASSSTKASRDTAVDARGRSSGAVVTNNGAAYGSSSGSIQASDSQRYSSNKNAAYAASEKDRYKERESAKASEFKMHVEEYFPPTLLQIKNPEPASLDAFTKRMLERDVRMVDNQVSQQIRAEMIGPKGVITDALKDEQMVSRKAMALGEKYNADAVAIGVAIVIDEGIKEGSYYTKANLGLRVIDTATGDILASEIISQGGVSSDATSSSRVSAARCGDVLGQELAEQLFQYWRRRDDKGIEVSIRIAGLQNTRQKLEAQDAITAVAGVLSLEERSYDNKNGMVEFMLTTKQKVAEVKNNVLRALYKVPGLEGLEEEMSLGANVNLVRH